MWSKNWKCQTRIARKQTFPKESSEQTPSKCTWVLINNLINSSIAFVVAFVHLHFAGDKLGHKRIWPCIWPVMELVLETQSSDHKLPSRRYTLPSHECCRFKRRRRAIPGSCGWQQEAEAWLRPPETDRDSQGSGSTEAFVYPVLKIASQAKGNPRL